LACKPAIFLKYFGTRDKTLNIVRWFGAQGQIGDAKRTSMVSTITSADAPAPLETKKFRTRESLRPPKPGDDIVTKRDPDAVLPDGWQVQTQE
jgi:hypothetical protein